MPTETAVYELFLVDRIVENDQTFVAVRNVATEGSLHWILGKLTELTFP